MTPLAGRFVKPLLALFVVAGVPTWLQAVTSAEVDDCARPASLLDAQRIPGSRAVEERAHRYSRSRFQWTEGEVAPDGAIAQPLRFRIVRSSDPSSFYGPPLLYLFDNPFPEDRTELRPIEAGGERLPVYWRHAALAPSFHAYFYVLGGRPVDGLFSGGVASAHRQIVSGARAVTLFLVQGVTARSPAGAVEARAEAWLADAWRHYQSVCGS